MTKPPLSPRQFAFKEQLYIELLAPANLERIRKALRPEASGYDINGAMQEVAENAVRAMIEKRNAQR